MRTYSINPNVAVVEDTRYDVWFVIGTLVALTAVSIGLAALFIS